MDQFFAEIQNYNNLINAIDPDTDSAVTELLSYLDGVAGAIKEMAAYQVPPHFSEVEALADQADALMSEALSLYYEAYTGEVYDNEKAEAAKVNYERANLRLRYIGELLRGETPSYELEY
jgi:hypothetical protein